MLSRKARLLKACLKYVIPKKIWPSPYLERLVLQRSGGKVVGGPFQGMNYVGQSFASAWIPKILGTYERELHPVIKEIIVANFSQIVDVGAAEGYYAVGFSVRCARARVIAFEMESEGRQLLRKTASLNGKANEIEVRGWCGCSELRQALAVQARRQLLMCDIEGGEDELLDVSTVPELATSWILVEVHEFISRGITERLRHRFDASHDVQEIWQEERHPGELPFSTLYTRSMPEKYLLWAVNEHRPERMKWLWMRPKHRDHRGNSSLS